MSRTWSTQTVTLPMQEGKPGGSIAVRLPPEAVVFDPKITGPRDLFFAWGPDWRHNPPDVTHTLHVVPQGEATPNGRHAGSFEWGRGSFSLYQENPYAQAAS